ncbi:MAG: sulfide/dihydroorotate dehydrogenase-like FAD/NAD-binding protein [Promethearchaeota archaeon]
MSSSIWDVICVGGGPAGLSCAIRSAELGLNVLILDARTGAATGAGMPVDDYPGFFSVTRQELLEKMTKQAKYHAKIAYGEEVTKMDLQGEIKRVYTQITKGDLFTEEIIYEAKTILIATGLRPSILDIPGERKFQGKGVFYSPPEGDYTEKCITVVGHTSWAVRATLHFDQIGAEVYLITRKNKIDTHPALMRRINDSFVKILTEHEIVLFEGTKHISKTYVKTKDDKRFSIPTDAVVILAGKTINRTLFLDSGLAITPRGRIITNDKHETNISGVYAAGSATREDSIVGVSAAEGIKAAESIYSLLMKVTEEKRAKEEKIEEKIEEKGLKLRFVEGRSQILEKEDLSPEIVKWIVKAPQIAKKKLPGQFVILRIHKKGERIPLTIAESDIEKGTITLIFQKLGKSTKLMGTMNAGDYILNLVGPLGKPVEIKKWGTVAVLGGGCGVAPVLPKAKAIKETGNYVISIISARSSRLLICREEMRDASHELYIATDDGTEGHHGFGLDILKKLIEEGRKIDHVVVVGPIPMMKFTSLYTKEQGIPTTVSLAPIMVDGTGMCGACRVTIGGEVKFACVDGPNFDGHIVDFDELMLRSQAYGYEERISVGKISLES